MKSLCIIAASAFLASNISLQTIVAPNFEYPIKDFICKPLPWAHSPGEAEATRARLQDPSACPQEQYPIKPEHTVVEVKCRPLPPVGRDVVAKLYADRLQDRRLCPAGQFPMRYGSGKDLSQPESCVPNGRNNLSWDWRQSGAIREPEIANTLATDLLMVPPYPSDQNWRTIDNNQSPSGDEIAQMDHNR